MNHLRTELAHFSLAFPHHPRNWLFNQRSSSRVQLGCIHAQRNFLGK